MDFCREMRGFCFWVTCTTIATSSLLFALATLEVLPKPVFSSSDEIYIPEQFQGGKSEDSKTETRGTYKKVKEEIYVLMERVKSQEEKILDLPNKVNQLEAEFREFNVKPTKTPAVKKSIIACEYTPLILSCEKGSLHITDAFYGRLRGDVCNERVRSMAYYPYPQSTTCAGKPADLQVVQKVCEGQSSCMMNVSNDHFGDPCPYTIKYLQVEYQCL